MLSNSINIASKNISTMLVILGLGLFCWAFILWYESKKDGFNSDRFFNLLFTSILLSLMSVYFLNRLYEWLKIFHPSNKLLFVNQNTALAILGFLVSLIPIMYFSKKYKWSRFRMFDIFSQGFCVLLMFLSAGYFLISKDISYGILFVLLVLIYALIMRRRGYKYMSGMIFSFFLFFISFSLVTYFRKDGYLLFASVLVTIGMVNLYFRGKKTMSKTILPENLISGLKKRLLSKEKRLEQEQQALIKEDPYLQQGRANDNSEVYDDVLEDTGKTITDARLGIVKGLKIQVRKALAAIKLGKYGKCEICGKDIDKARLEVYPEATTCIECATDHSQLDDIKADEILEKNL